MSRVRFPLYRVIPRLGYHHILMILLVVSNLFTALLLAGCASPIMRNIYVLSYSYRQLSTSGSAATLGVNLTSTLRQFAQDGDLHVRAGYFSICASLLNESDWKCANNVEKLRKAVGNSSDPFDLIGNAHHFRSKVIFPGILIVAALLVLLAFLGFFTFPSWHEETTDTGSVVEVKPFPSRDVSSICVGFAALAMFLHLISAVWQHAAAATAGSAVEYAVQRNIRVSVGSAAAAFVWLPFLLSFIVVVAAVVMVLSIAILDSLTSEDNDSD